MSASETPFKWHLAGGPIVAVGGLLAGIYSKWKNTNSFFLFYMNSIWNTNGDYTNISLFSMNKKINIEGFNKTIIELRLEISYYVVCATNKGSDQPAHTRSLIRAFASRLNII